MARAGEWRLSEVSAIKSFGRVVQCAARVGDEMSLEALSDRLVVRALNGPRSICAEFTLFPAFFSAHLQSGDNRSATVHVKSLLPVFRQSGSLKILVMRMEDEKRRLLLETTSIRNVTKRFLLPYEDTEVVRALFTRDSCPSHFTTRPRFLLDALGNFHARLDEMSMFISPKSLRFASFFDDPDSAKNAMLRTEMTLEAREFEEFWVQPATNSRSDFTELTFNCRALRAVMDFCEPVFDNATAVYFDCPGSPILITNALKLDAASLIEVNFIFATRQPTDSDESTEGNGREAQQTSTRVRAGPRPPANRENSISTVPTTTPRQPEKTATNSQNRASQAADDEFVEATPPPSP